MNFSPHSSKRARGRRAWVATRWRGHHLLTGKRADWVYVNSKVHSAPPPPFSLTSFGWIAQVRCEMTSKTRPAVPSDPARASTNVAKSSCALRPCKTDVASPNFNSHECSEISTHARWESALQISPQQEDL